MAQLFQPTPEQITTWVIRHFQFKSRKSGVELKINNPFDGDDGLHFNINTIKAKCHDWRPGHQQYDGSFIRFVQKYKNLTFQEALKDICGNDIDLRDILKPKTQNVESEEEKIIDVSLPDGVKSLRDDTSKMAKMVVAYLMSRGVNLELAYKFDIHHGGGKIYFPYYEYGAQVYWQARAIHDKIFEFPELGGAGIGKEKFLYGFDNVEPLSILIVVESIFNAITLGDGAVATGGADMSMAQARKIRALNPSIIILAPDRDNTGIMSVSKNASTLRSIVNADIQFVIPPKVKDWNDMWQGNPRLYVDQNAKPANAVNINKAVMSIQ